MRASRVLAVASSLSHMGPSELATVLTERGITPADSAHPLELASQSLDTSAVTTQLSHLSANDLQRLMRARAGDATVLGSADDARLLAESRDSERHLAPEIDEALDTITPSQSTPQAQTGRPVDVVAVLALVENMETLIRAAGSTPAPGATAEALASWAATHGDEAATWTTAAEMCRFLGFLAVHHGSWHQTTASSKWLAAALSERWAMILRSLWETRPQWLDTSGSSSSDLASQPGGWVHRAGLVGLDLGDEKGSALRELAQAGDIDSWVATQLPPTVEQVYPDGPDTLVTAGPLPVSQERALRRIGRWVSGNIASRFHLTPETVLRSRQRGDSVDEITEAIELVVPGGKNSALGLTLLDTLSRADQMRIQWSESGSTVECLDSLALELLLADRKLQSLAFQKVSESTLTSSHSVDSVHELLSSEGYPHLVIDQAGDVFDVDREELVQMPDTAAGRDHTASSLLDAWRSWQESAPADWWEPCLEWAIAHKIRVTAVVNINGVESEFVIEPKSLQNGRLRARDTRSDVERTIPVSHLVRMHSPEAVSPES